jgi:hypothetical protein
MILVPDSDSRQAGGNMRPMRPMRHKVSVCDLAKTARPEVGSSAWVVVPCEIHRKEEKAEAGHTLFDTD